MPLIHDPSTVVHFRGKYWVYGTGPGIRVYSSPDGETWTREKPVFERIPEEVHAGVPKNDGVGVWAPDIVRANGQFNLYYAVSSWGSFQSAIGLATNPTLDPKDPAYKWTDRGVVVSSNGSEDLNAIDPGVILAPDGTLWICYGSYHGSIRITQLDPKTGLALKPKTLGQAVASARESEASDIIFHNGYYYLFVNHGSCCKGRLSEYNIRVGRSKKPDGPYLDKHGEPLAKGAGSLFLAAHDHRIGPGHFGRLLDYDKSTNGDEGGPERFSIHYEADLTRNGPSVLDIRPLLWSVDDWPVAGDNLGEGTYQIVSRQSEYTLEEHASAEPGKTATADAEASGAQSTAASTAPGTARLVRYITLDSQKWKIAPVKGGFYSVVNAGTGDALGLGGSGAELAPYAGKDEQIWRLEQFPDGGYRVVNKATGKCLAVAGMAVTVGDFVRDDSHLWTIMTP
ncbi:MAG TPA: family 43 glycosylhydrolase [Bryobacteraceae bacterium]